MIQKKGEKDQIQERVEGRKSVNNSKKEEYRREGKKSNFR